MFTKCTGTKKTLGHLRFVSLRLFFSTDSLCLGLFPKETNSSKTKSSSFRFNPFTEWELPNCLLTYPIESHTNKFWDIKFLKFQHLKT